MSRYPNDSSYPHHYRLQVDLPMHRDLLLEILLLRKETELTDLLGSLLHFVLPQRKNHRVSLSIVLREWWQFYE
jgi:hypothetical protein